MCDRYNNYRQNKNGCKAANICPKDKKLKDKQIILIESLLKNFAGIKGHVLLDIG